MTDLELWCFACITFTFLSLISYVIILFTLGCPLASTQVNSGALSLVQIHPDTVL